LFWKENHVEAVLCSFPSNGEEDVFGNSVEKNDPHFLLQEEGEKGGREEVHSFFPKRK